jgi:hypothetical protein
LKVFISIRQGKSEINRETVVFSGKENVFVVCEIGYGNVFAEILWRISGLSGKKERFSEYVAY